MLRFLRSSASCKRTSPTRVPPPTTSASRRTRKSRTGCERLGKASGSVEAPEATLGLPDTRELLLLCGCPRRKTSLYGGRASAAARFATPRSVIVRGRPRQAPGTCRARGADDRWLASPASQVALSGLRLAEFADFVFARSASGEEGERPTCVRRAARAARAA